MNGKDPLGAVDRLRAAIQVVAALESELFQLQDETSRVKRDLVVAATELRNSRDALDVVLLPEPAP